MLRREDEIQAGEAGEAGLKRDVSPAAFVDHNPGVDSTSPRSDTKVPCPPLLPASIGVVAMVVV